MEKNNLYENRILQTWEEVYKKGQLTFWILLSLKNEPNHMGEMKKFIDEATNGTIIADDKSMYRALRRLNQMELVDFREEPGTLGPAKKIYCLSGIGKNVLDKFIERNVLGIYFKSDIIKLMKKKG